MFEAFSTRRAFLQKGLSLLAAIPTIPSFLDRTALAMAQPLDTKRTQQPSGKDGKILVIVQLSGGNDGLNMIVPYADDAYHRARPTLAIAAKRVLKIDDYLGVHPNMRALKSLFDDGRVSVIQGVGYPNPNRSHFRAMDIWHSAQPERENPSSGWIGRYFDHACAGCDPDVGVSIDEQLPLAMQGERVRPISFERPEVYRYQGPDRPRYEALLSGARQAEAESSSGELKFLERTAMDAQMSSDEIHRLASGHRPPVPYPGGEFGVALRTTAAMIRGGMPTRVYYLSLGGFDTHANQKDRHDRLMQQLDAGIHAFSADLAAQKNDDRVLILTFSEFGRRVAQNGSNGTDHGAAAPMLLIGSQVRQGVIGQHPSLTDLSRGDLKHSTDFRSVYATVLQRWLETPSTPILGREYPLLPVLNG